MTTDTSFLPGDDVQRREFLMLLVTDGEILKTLTDDIGGDVLPFAVQAMAVELVKTSIAADGMREDIEGLKVAVASLGGLSAGLLGMSEGGLVVDDDEDEGVTAFRNTCREQGARIRSGAGLMPLVAS